MHQFKLETAVRAWQEEGAAGLRATLERMDEMFPKGHVLLDAEGRDVLTGEDRSALRARSQRRFNEISTRDGRYTLVFAMPPPPPPPLWLWPYLVLIAALDCGDVLGIYAAPGQSGSTSPSHGSRIRRRAPDTADGIETPR